MQQEPLNSSSHGKARVSSTATLYSLIRRACIRSKPATVDKITVDAGTTSSSHQFRIRGTTGVCLFTAVRPGLDEETLRPLRKPVFVVRPAIGYRIALSGVGSQIRIGRTLLWFTFHTLVGTGTSAHVLGKFVR
jgi:hypothetical protein